MDVKLFGYQFSPKPILKGGSKITKNEKPNPYCRVPEGRGLHQQTSISNSCAP